MIRFAHLHFIWLFAAVLLLFILMLRSRKKRRESLKRFAEGAVTSKLLQGFRIGRRRMRENLMLLAIAFLVLGLIGPQVGKKLKEVKRKGVDIVIALDVSTSMNAKDITPSRLGRAKYEAAKFIEKLKGDRVGLVAFAGISYLHCPLTLDYSASKLFLDAIDTGIIGTQGTAIADAIMVAMNSFASEEKKHKVVIVVSDGEDHEGDLETALTNAGETGTVIYSVGVGTLTGSPIPVVDPKTGEADFKRDRSGRVVTSALEEQTLQHIASVTGGKYYSMATTQDVFSKIYDEIMGLEEKEFSSHEYSDYREQFQIFIAIGLLLMLIEFILPERKKTLTENDSENDEA